MIDDEQSDVYGRTEDGEYHKTLCITVPDGEFEDTFGLLPDGAELESCCSD